MISDIHHSTEVIKSLIRKVLNLIREIKLRWSIRVWVISSVTTSVGQSMIEFDSDVWARKRILCMGGGKSSIASGVHTFCENSTDNNVFEKLGPMVQI